MASAHTACSCTSRRCGCRSSWAHTADLLPTLLVRLGLAAPAGLDGVDLLAASPRRDSYAETLYPRSLGWAPLHALRLGTIKYIDAPRPELYDLASDPREERDLAAQRPADLARMREALATLRRDEASGAARAADAET